MAPDELSRYAVPVSPTIISLIKFDNASPRIVALITPVIFPCKSRTGIATIKIYFRDAADNEGSVITYLPLRADWNQSVAATFSTVLSV